MAAGADADGGGGVWPSQEGSHGGAHGTRTLPFLRLRHGDGWNAEMLEFAFFLEEIFA